MNKQRIAKVLLVIVMILGILFSIANFVSIGLKGTPPTGGAMKGVWKYNQFGEKVCEGKGDECDINGAIE